MEPLPVLSSKMELHTLLFPRCPRLEWRIWTLFAAFVGCQLAFLVVNIALDDALGGSLILLSFLVGLSCAIWRRLLLIAINLVLQSLLFLLMIICAATGASSMKVWSQVGRYKLLLVLHFSVYAFGIVVSAILLHLSRSRPRRLAAGTKEAPASVAASGTHDAPSDVGSEHSTTQGLCRIRDLFVSKQFWSAHGTHSSAEAKSASGPPRESVSTDSGGEVSAPSDATTTPRKGDAYSEQSFTEEDHHFFCQGECRGHGAGYFYHAAFSDFLSSPSLSLPTTMPAASPVMCATTHMHARAMPSLLQQSSGSTVGFLSVPEEERRLHRPSSESVVVFNATDEKGLVLLHTTSASPAPSPKNGSSIATSFGLPSPLPTHSVQDAGDRYVVGTPRVTGDQALALGGAARRCRVGAYSFENYTDNCSTSMEDALPTFVVQLTGVHEHTDTAAEVKALPLETAPAGENPELPGRRVLPKGTWNVLKKKCHRSVRSALLYLGNSGEAALDSSAPSAGELPFRTSDSYANRGTPRHHGGPTRITTGRKRPRLRNCKARRATTSGVELGDLSARKHLVEERGVSGGSSRSSDSKRERSKEFLVCWAGEVASSSGLSVPDDALLQAADAGRRMESILTSSSSEEEGNGAGEKAMNEDEASATGRPKEYDREGLLSFLSLLPVQTLADRERLPTASEATVSVVNLTASRLFPDLSQDKRHTADDEPNLLETSEAEAGDGSEPREERYDSGSYLGCPPHLASSEISSDIFPELEMSEDNRSRSQDSFTNTEKSCPCERGLAKRVTGAETHSLCSSDGTYRLSPESSQEHLFAYSSPYSSAITQREAVHARIQQVEEGGPIAGEVGYALGSSAGLQNTNQWDAGD
ncbi:proteophosphoglycan protein ppg4 [Cystoisospora suis]|uniref:Proteophosphoglycan protein ppg4 n=1 Tax=Cystoisospora suis TaxID=483139 RepID=A0A2C6L564_9APIC|nr:proteophosphoglycan protein ppg4 [Cystoisospora suis]